MKKHAVVGIKWNLCMKRMRLFVLATKEKMLISIDTNQSPAMRSHISCKITTCAGYVYYLFYFVFREDEARGSHWSNSMANNNLYKSHTWAFIARLSLFSRYPHIKNSWPRKCRSKSWRSTVAVAPFDGKYLTYYLMAVTMFAISLTVYEIFTNRKCQKFDLENEGQG